MMNILKVNTIELTIIKPIMLLMYLAAKIVINKEMTECKTPKNKSYATIGEKNKLVKNTPRTIPKKYFLLNTIK